VHFFGDNSIGFFTEANLLPYDQLKPADLDIRKYAKHLQVCAPAPAPAVQPRPHKTRCHRRRPGRPTPLPLP
jgi:hypothetical protein